MTCDLPNSFLADQLWDWGSALFSLCFTFLICRWDNGIWFHKGSGRITLTEVMYKCSSVLLSFGLYFLNHGKWSCALWEPPLTTTCNSTKWARSPSALKTPQEELSMWLCLVCVLSSAVPRLGAPGPRPQLVGARVYL